MAESDPYCSICLDTFKDPIATQCNHVFCARCLKKHEEMNAIVGEFPCPLCNREIVLTQTGGSGVKKEASDQRDDSNEEILPRCDGCWHKMSATSRCLDCAENYCQAKLNLNLKQDAKTQTMSRRVRTKNKDCTKQPLNSQIW
ncbi:hypothetical protein ACJMK2_018909 [Sinanodonta woodiana]|uniref:RING-type domain-containing protein n=1 Tax=Sinanodonta woodiana TaxID=1069815 RepID=A0ABD3UGD8_SINWO